MPIDHFFRSLAEARAERAIGIVLSGTGSDGAAGLKEIKGAGGMTMVQQPETAAYDGPRSRRGRSLRRDPQADVQRRLIERFHFALREQRCLFLGKFESLSGTAKLFEEMSSTDDGADQLRLRAKGASGACAVFARACRDFVQRVQHSVFGREVEPAQWVKPGDRFLKMTHAKSYSLRLCHLAPLEAPHRALRCQARAGA